MLLLLSLIGCLRITYTSGPPLERDAEHKEWHHRFAQGMIEVPGPYDAMKDCPGGVRQVRTQVSVENQLATAAANQMGAAVGIDTSGVYSPSTIEVWCKRGD